MVTCGEVSEVAGLVTRAISEGKVRWTYECMFEDACPGVDACGNEGVWCGPVWETPAGVGVCDLWMGRFFTNLARVGGFHASPSSPRPTA